MARIQHPSFVCLLAAFASAATVVSGVRLGSTNAQEPITSPINPKAPAGAAVAGLSARLGNAAVGKDESIELDFVLRNRSDAKIVLAERWNSWGAYQWTLRVVDAKGAEFVLRNPQLDWYRNGFTTFTIEPSDRHITRCRLDNTSWKKPEGPIELFSEVDASVGASDRRRQNSWAFPVSITGVFSAPKENLADGKKAGSNWAGTITTNAVQVGKPPRLESPDHRRTVVEPEDASGESLTHSDSSSRAAAPPARLGGAPERAGASSQAESERLSVALADRELPCGVGRVDFSTRAEKTPMVIWMFQELERLDAASEEKPADHHRAR